MVFESLLMLVLIAFTFSGLCLCYAIAADASARGASGLFWGVFVFGLFPLAVPAYLLYRTRLPTRTEPAGQLEQVLGAFGIGGTVAVILSSVLTPPDPFSLLVYGPPLLIVLVPAAFVLCYDPGWRALAS